MLFNLQNLPFLSSLISTSSHEKCPSFITTADTVGNAERVITGGDLFNTQPVKELDNKKQARSKKN
jgi:hypothetical protein